MSTDISMRLDISELPPDIAEFASVVPDILAIGRGRPVSAVETGGEGFSVAFDGQKVKITYGGRGSLMMALGAALAGKSGEWPAPRFEFRAIMLDASRNAVPKPEYLRQAILRMAMLGLNHFCLYTEDTFQVDGDPLFGYGRGAYTKAELSDLDAFAAKAGVTMFPCMQTLGHFEQVLKHEKYAAIRDNHRVLNTTLPETYDFIERLIENASAPYKTRMIHLGTDEPWGLGRGKSFNPEKPTPPSDIYTAHLARLGEICQRRGLHGVIWGDYVLGHSGDKALSDAQIAKVPKSLTTNYWNYDPKNEYDKDLGFLAKSGFDVIVSPGMHNWNNFWGLHANSTRNFRKLMDSAEKHGVRKVMMTLWGDDGQECLFENNLANISEYLQASAGETGDGWKDMLKAVFGKDNKCFEATDALETLGFPEVGGDKKFKPSAKALFYDDPLLGFVNRMFDDNSPAALNEAAAKGLYALADKYPNDFYRLTLAAFFADVSASKFRISRDARKAYAAKDRDALTRVADKVYSLSVKLFNFQNLYRKMWMAERKPFGFEVMDNRLGAMNARIDSLSHRIGDFLDGTNKDIPEFEFETCRDAAEFDFAWHSKIITKSYMLWGSGF